MQRYGIIGRPVAQSASADFFNQFFLSHKVRAEFSLFEPSDEDLGNFRTWFFKNQLNGLLVTIPFKKLVLPFLDELSDAAKSIGAVNVILRKGTLLSGINTDCAAFAEELQSFHHKSFRNALLLGNGGAAAAIEYALKSHQVFYTKVSRNKSATCISYDALDEKLLSQADLVINATPLGMKPFEQQAPPICYKALQPGTLAFDLIYHPAETQFLKHAREAGCLTLNGRGMVHRIYENALNYWDLS